MVKNRDIVRRSMRVEEELVVVHTPESGPSEIAEKRARWEMLAEMFTAKEVAAMMAALPKDEECNHNLSDAATTCAVSETIDHYDFTLKDEWDVIRLYAPFMSKDGHHHCICYSHPYCHFYHFSHQQESPSLAPRIPFPPKRWVGSNLEPAFLGRRLAGLQVIWLSHDVLDA